MATVTVIPQQCPPLYIRTAHIYCPVCAKSCMQCCPASMGLVTTGAGSRVWRHTYASAKKQHEVLERKERLANYCGTVSRSVSILRDCVTQCTNINLVPKCTNGLWFAMCDCALPRAGSDTGHVFTYRRQCQRAALASQDATPQCCHRWPRYRPASRGNSAQGQTAGVPNNDHTKYFSITALVLVERRINHVG